MLPNPDRESNTRRVADLPSAYLLKDRRYTHNPASECQRLSALWVWQTRACIEPTRFPNSEKSPPYLSDRPPCRIDT